MRELRHDRTCKEKNSKQVSKNARKSTSRAAGKQSNEKGSGVRVRMYNVGFGDCFLLFIPTPRGEKRVFIDCGSIAKQKLQIGDIAEQVVNDVKDPDGVPRIDVIVMTHRHRDHISGFASAIWDQVEAKEVWMPWTEDPEDPAARRIRDLQTRLALSLQQIFSAQSGQNRLRELALNAASNEDAMRTLHDGFAGQPTRYFARW
jgi:beta-lactamase superfamily II metal-dependent hydrolase